MIWNVYRENFNNNSIIKYNIFNHNGFAKEINELLKENTTKDEFAEQLKWSLRYYFWGKSEYEVVITSWVTYIDREELNRINNEYEEYNDKWGYYPYKINISPDVSKKVDIYSQVMLNWEQFVDYVWSNKDE